MLGNVAGKSKPIGVAGHLNVRKKQGYARRPNFQKLDGFIAGADFVKSKTGTLQYVTRMHQDDRVIVDDKRIGAG